MTAPVEFYGVMLAITVWCMVTLNRHKAPWPVQAMAAGCVIALAVLTFVAVLINLRLS